MSNFWRLIWIDMYVTCNLFLCVCLCLWFLSPSHPEVCGERQTILFPASLHLFANNPQNTLACSFAWVNCTILSRKRLTITCLHLFIASQQMAKMPQISSKKVTELVTGHRSQACSRTFFVQNLQFAYNRCTISSPESLFQFAFRIFSISHFPILILIAFSDSDGCLVANQFS